MSNCGSPADSIAMRQKVADDSVATQPGGTVVPNPAVKANGQSVTSTASCQPRSHNGFASSSSITLASPANIDTLPYRVNKKRLQHAFFDLILGQQDPTSSYFTRRFFSEPFVGDESSAAEPPKDVLHHFPELDPQAFEIYKIYTHFGKVAFNSPAEINLDYVWISCWPLMNAHILGCIIEEHAFADRVMDTMAERLALTGPPDPQTVEHLFDLDRESISEVLKAFVIDGFIDAQQRSCDVLKTTSYPANFNKLALQSALQHLSHSQGTTTNTGCEYHTHGSKEACYKSILTATDTLKEQRLAAARETSARDAELVTANALRHGVRSIDWEQRRANAVPALKIETSQTRSNLRRLAYAQSVQQIQSTQTSSNQTNSSTSGKQDTDQSLDWHGLFSPTIGTRSRYHLPSTPHNSPVLQAQSAEMNDNNAALPASHTNGNVLISGPAFEEIGPPQAFLLAELEDSSVASHITKHALEYKHSIDLVRISEDQVMPTNGAGKALTQGYDSSDSASPSNLSEEVALEHEGYVRCPGAYPKSDIGV